MKKILLTIMSLVTVVASGYAQNWKMVITLSDGTQQELATSDVKQITYVEGALPDKNVDQIIIKEIYNGGCMKDDGNKFQFDKCIILYNNCGEQAVANNVCFGMLDPANAHSTNSSWRDENGNLPYEAEGYLPAWNGIWWFQHPLVIEPYSQVVVNIHGAIDNTKTVSQSVNYANKDYYCMYDPEGGYTHSLYYPTPADEIPTSHYLKAKRIGLGSGWAYSVNSPATILFQTQEMSPSEFAEDADRQVLNPKSPTQAFVCLKVPNEWVIDGVEVFSASYATDSQKRLTDDIDGGYVFLTNYLGHSLYRNVDKQATEALPENAGKLVYGYSLGVDGSTDPSGIDAEKS